MKQITKIKVLRRREVAKMFGVSNPTILEYERRGLLHPIRFSSKSVRYREADVLNLLENGAGALQPNGGANLRTECPDATIK